MKHETTLRIYTAEMRALENSDNKEVVIEGTPIVFNQWTHIGGEDPEEGFDEVLVPMSFVNTDMRDVVLTIEHDGRKIPLARTKNGKGTMTLTKTAQGINMRAVLDVENNTEARAVYSAIKRGDLDKMSFLFIVAQDGDAWVYENNRYKREIHAVEKLLDVSIVARPAYSGTSVELSRSEVDALGGMLDDMKRVKEIELLKEKNKILANI